MGLNRKLLGMKTVTLKGIVDQGSIRAEVNTAGKKRLQKHNAIVKGRINIPLIPKYRQTGEMTLLKANEQYLAIHIMRVDNVVTPDDRGSVNTFVTVEWNGLIKKTKTIHRSYKPVYDELFYFPIVISGADKRDRNKRKVAIMNELKSNPKVLINIWAQDIENSNDNIGYSSYFLQELKNGKVDEKEFYDENERTMKSFKSRIWSGHKKLTSAFVVEGHDSNLYFDSWILYENELELDYEDLP
jgi:centrosomal protein CEP76